MKKTMIISFGTLLKKLITYLFNIMKKVFCHKLIFSFPQLSLLLKLFL